MSEDATLAVYGQWGWWSWGFIEGHSISVLYLNGYIVEATLELEDMILKWRARA